MSQRRSKAEPMDHCCMSLYHNAVLEAMDRKKEHRNLEHWIKQVADRSGTMGKGQRWFLLNKLFDLRPSEIAEMEGMKGSSSVRQLIIRVSDQLKAGEIRLMEFTPEETAEAKERLDAHRAKRRDRHNRNKDQINAKRRE